MGKQNDRVSVSPEQGNTDSIQQIREIIFGEVINSWEDNFRKLEKKLGDLDKKIDLIQADLRSCRRAQSI